MKSEGVLDEGELDEFQNLLVSAARDCVPRDRSSFVELQANTGVEVSDCTLVNYLLALFLVICFADWILRNEAENYSRSTVRENG